MSLYSQLERVRRSWSACSNIELTIYSKRCKNRSCAVHVYWTIDCRSATVRSYDESCFVASVEARCQSFVYCNIIDNVLGCDHSVCDCARSKECRVTARRPCGGVVGTSHDKTLVDGNETVCDVQFTANLGLVRGRGDDDGRC